MSKIYQKSFFCGNKAGFTLIELLVAALIIGLLAAVAAAQYQVAAAKSRVTRALPLFRAITDAQDRYFMQTGEYTADVDLLDIRVPYTSKTAVEGDAGRYRYGGSSVGSFTLSPNHFLVWGGGGFTIDYYGKIPGSRYVAICYPQKDNAPGHKVCKSFGRDTGRISSVNTPVYALDF